MTLSDADKQVLKDGLQKLGLEYSDSQFQQLVSYGNLILKWNRVYNLTAIRTSGEVTTHHLLDSLAAVPAVQTEVRGRSQPRLLDVGSGAGLPGIVLAICLPQLQVVTLDTVQKKVAFMRQAMATLGLQNAQAIHSRVEEWKDPTGFDIVCSRAFSTMENMIAWSSHLLSSNGKFLALKGKAETDHSVTGDWKIASVMRLEVPFLAEERNIFVISR